MQLMILPWMLRADADLPEVDLDSIAMLQYTSGSTSSPRAVQVTHGNLIANLDVMRSMFYREGSVGTVCWLPLFHDMGLIGMVMTSLVSGITANLMGARRIRDATHPLVACDLEDPIRVFRWT